MNCVLLPRPFVTRSGLPPCPSHLSFIRSYIHPFISCQDHHFFPGLSFHICLRFIIPSTAHSLTATGSGKRKRSEEASEAENLHEISILDPIWDSQPISAVMTRIQKYVRALFRLQNEKSAVMERQMCFSFHPARLCPFPCSYVYPRGPRPVPLESLTVEILQRYQDLGVKFFHPIPDDFESGDMLGVHNSAFPAHYSSVFLPHPVYCVPWFGHCFIESSASWGCIFSGDGPKMVRGTLLPPTQIRNASSSRNFFSKTSIWSTKSG